MKPMSKRIVILVAGGAVIAGTLVACGHHRYHNPEKRGEWLVEKVTDELELNETQQAKLEAVRQEILAVRKDTLEDRQTMREEVLAMLDQPQLDRQKVLAMVEKKTTSINQHAPQVVNALGEFYDSLSDEQRNEVREHFSEMSERHHHHW
ncbi:Spy/CpxP family protein refolding chaperone [Kaarinaea lacus]